MKTKCIATIKRYRFLLLAWLIGCGPGRSIIFDALLPFDRFPELRFSVEMLCILIGVVFLILQGRSDYVSWKKNNGGRTTEEERKISTRLRVLRIMAIFSAVIGVTIGIVVTILVNQ